MACQGIELNPGTAASDYIQLHDGKSEAFAMSFDRIQHVAADNIAALQCPNEHALAA